MVAMRGRLAGRVALVSGSSRGIGRGIAERFAREGASVGVTWHEREEAAREVVRSIEKEGGRAHALQLDVTVRASIRRVVAATIEHFGTLDVVVHNAGFLEQKPFATIDDDDWDYTFACNLKSAFMIAQEVRPHFESRCAGNLIHLASIGGQTGGIKAPHYAASKAGLISLTRSLAKLYAPLGVRVNAISPGYIATDMYTDIATRESEDAILETIPLHRIGLPEDVAGAAVYLASADASYVTGQILNVNGGSYLG
jgi:NAD(P)-dependent dehydrogenase (short-subunit alcohol dehydrogenase family)